MRKTVHLVLPLVFCSAVTVFGQWSAATSGTTDNLNGVYLLDSGVGFAVGDAGTILKTTDAGMTWSPLTSGTTNALQDVYFFDATQVVAVGEQGLILRTTDGGAGWHGVTSGVTDTLRSVSLDSKWRRTGVDPDAYSNSYAQRDTTRYSHSQGSSHTAASSVHSFPVITLSHR